MTTGEQKVPNLISQVNEYYQDLLGYSPVRTQLQMLDDRKWYGFCQKLGLNGHAEGIFLPRNLTAIVKGNSENLPLNIFHEYFGHGLFCEQSLIGEKLVDLERKLLGEETQKFQGKEFTLKDVQKFRQQNATFQDLEELRKQNLGIYENFAVWTEYLLSREFALKDEFGRKYDSLFKENKEEVEKLISFNAAYGNLATFYNFGLARTTTPERARKLLIDIHGNDKIKKSKFILLTGSKKPFSDIDLFASSDYLQTIKNEWLDLVAFNEKDFNRMMALFEPRVTHPLFWGEFVAGDRDYFEEKKKQLLNQPITEEAIQHNLRLSKEQGKLAQDYPKNSKERQIGLSYAETYLANSLALKEDERLFTKEKLIRYSQGENIKMKGGLK